jgi:hypothetical protein
MYGAKASHKQRFQTNVLKGKKISKLLKLSILFFFIFNKQCISERYILR